MLDGVFPPLHTACKESKTSTGASSNFALLLLLLTYVLYSFDVIERQEHQLPFFSSAIVTRPIVLNSQHIDVNTHTPAASQGKGEKYNKNVVCGDDNCVNGKKKEVPEKGKTPS